MIRRAITVDARMKPDYARVRVPVLAIYQAQRPFEEVAAGYTIRNDQERAALCLAARSRATRSISPECSTFFLAAARDGWPPAFQRPQLRARAARRRRRPPSPDRPPADLARHGRDAGVSRPRARLAPPHRWSPAPRLGGPRYRRRFRPCPRVFARSRRPLRMSTTASEPRCSTRSLDQPEVFGEHL